MFQLLNVVCKWIEIQFTAIGGAVPPPSSAPSFTPQPPQQANPPVPTPQPYGGEYLVSINNE